jgi:hypothetical protein
MPDRFTYDVFLSHNSKDKPRVRKLAEDLRAAGLRVWFDEWVLKPGDDIYLSIERGLEAARAQVPRCCACRRRRWSRSGWRSNAALCCSATRPMPTGGGSYRCCLLTAGSWTPSWPPAEPESDQPKQGPQEAGLYPLVGG